MFDNLSLWRLSLRKKNKVNKMMATISRRTSTARTAKPIIYRKKCLSSHRKLQHNHYIVNLTDEVQFTDTQPLTIDYLQKSEYLHMIPYWSTFSKSCLSVGFRAFSFFDTWFENIDTCIKVKMLTINITLMSLKRRIFSFAYKN